MADPRKRRALPLDLRPIMVSHEIAAAMLAQIGERTLDQLVAEGRIVARQVTRGRVGYLLRDLEAFCAALPQITPGQEKRGRDDSGAHRVKAEHA